MSKYEIIPAGAQARMESRAYAAYSLETLARVFDVLGTKLEIHPVSQEAA